MTTLHSVAEMQAAAEAARCAGARLALVPTMGALHDGHLALVDAARQRGSHVTVSIFVNPTQFGPGEDFDRYPRTLEADLAALRQRGGVDCVFAPAVEDMYPAGASTTVHVRELGRHLCGAHRPGHFDGVATVVTRLFTACRPHVAIFGSKDAQQLVIVTRLAADLGFGVEVAGVETVREPDGLAMSSRNRYLAPDERRQAVVLSRAVTEARLAIAGGERDARAVARAMAATVAEAPLARLQYAEVVDAETLQPLVEIAPRQRVLAAVAAYLGTTRLIDNQFADAPA
jgi:pantoate--beta-alanine ligase